MPGSNNVCPGCGSSTLNKSKKRAKDDPETAYRCWQCGYSSGDTLPHPDTSVTSDTVMAILQPGYPWSRELTGNQRATIAHFISTNCNS